MTKILKLAWRGFRRWLTEPRVFWRASAPNVEATVEIRRWAPLLAVLALLGWYVASPAPVVLMALVALGGALLVAFYWARMLARGVRGQRELRFAAMQVGDELEEQIRLENRTPLPVLWAEFFDRSSIPGYTVSSARAADPGARVSWRAHTICTRRGVFSLGPWEMRLGEPFGFFLVRQLYLQRQDILVYPPLAALPDSLLPHHGALGDHRPLNQPLRAETIASSAVRAYAPGDPLRHVHWPTTARRDAPFVKVFSPEAASNVWLVPDLYAGVQFGLGDASSLETAVTVAASLAARLLQQNLSVGLFTNAAEEMVVLPRQGSAHLWDILQALAPLQPGICPLEETLLRARGLVSGRDLLILITPSLHPGWIAPLRRIARSRSGAGRAEVILLGPDIPAEPAEPEGAWMEKEAETFRALLLENGLPAALLRPREIRRISGAYGEISRWEFSILGTGRAVARRAPRAARSDNLPGSVSESRMVRSR
jgi:uncharacterized protein (DUF58 family)